ncbi:hypothetical protein M3Y99_01429000 [Aphelenchoides fujianensis]|nr:hypothetical protein M3Y99_01429000 [Aphelenchoides fujianensis]
MGSEDVTDTTNKEPNKRKTETVKKAATAPSLPSTSSAKSSTSDSTESATDETPEEEIFLPPLHQGGAPCTYAKQTDIPVTPLPLKSVSGLRSSSGSSAVPRVQEVEPSFVTYGLDSAANALLIVEDPYATDEAEEEYLLLVGTNKGEVYMYDILSKKSVGIVYKIPHRGTNPLTNKKRTEKDFLLDEEDMQTYKQAGIVEMGAFSTTYIWIQFRGGMLGIFAWNLADAKYTLKLEKRFIISHAGFCRGLYDAPHERFVLPDKKSGGYTGFCLIDDHENKTIFELDGATLRADCTRSKGMDRKSAFSGGIFFVRPYHWNVTDLFFVMFEDATLMLYDVGHKSVVEWHQRELLPEQTTAVLAVDWRPLFDEQNVQAAHFVISEPDLVYLLFYDPHEQRFTHNSVIKDLINEQHCTAVAWGPENFLSKPPPMTDVARFAVGYSSGDIEVYGARFDAELDNFSCSLLFISGFLQQTIIRFGWHGRRDMLFATTDVGEESGKVAHFDDIRLPKRPRHGRF